MKTSSLLPLACVALLSAASLAARAGDDDVLLSQMRPAAEQTLGHGRSALWTLPIVATQYAPAQLGAAMREALQAHQDGRFLDALIRLEAENRAAPAGSPLANELTLLRASLLLQGRRTDEAHALLAPLLGDATHGADAAALDAMAWLQQGRLVEALTAARRARQAGNGLLPCLALSYAHQAQGRLQEARQEIHSYNQSTPDNAVALAREAELALTLDQPAAARPLAAAAVRHDAAHPYVVAVSGLVALIDGRAAEARLAFDTALRRDPRDAKTLFGLGLAEVRLGDIAAGAARLHAASEADPGNALILTYLGRAQLALGQTDAASASLRAARQADPRDPVPWLYQAQLDLQRQRLADARASLDAASSRLKDRAVYRGDKLLREDEQQWQAHLAELQRQSGLERLAFQTLTTPVGANSSANLRNQADLLQGQRHAESARRNLLLQSLFGERPGALPAQPDLYGDGAGMTGAATPQRGFVSQLGAAQTSYHHYDELFARRTQVDAELHAGSRNTAGGSVRAAVGNDRLGIGLAHTEFSSDGFAPLEELDNRVLHAVVQWRPHANTQAFLARQNFDSDWSGNFYPAEPWALAARLADTSQVTRLGLRQRLDDDGNREVWALLSRQTTDQAVDSAAPYTGYGDGHSAELQFRQRSAGQAMQWGAQQLRSDVGFDYPWGGVDRRTIVARHAYAAWQQDLGSAWQLEAMLGWGHTRLEDHTGVINVALLRWLPHLGAVYRRDTAHGASHLRLTAWQSLGIQAPGNASLAPASLVGLPLGQPDDIVANGMLTRTVALAYDRPLAADWLLTGAARRRRGDVPGISTDYASGALVAVTSYFRNDDATLGVHWQPGAGAWTLGLNHDYERIGNDRGIGSLDSLDAQTLRAARLDVRWRPAERWTAQLTLSHNRLAGALKATSTETWTPTYPEFRARFNQVDASLAWRLAPAGSQLTLGVRNAGDRRVDYVDIDKLNPRYSHGRLAYARIRLAW